MSKETNKKATSNGSNTLKEDVTSNKSKSVVGSTVSQKAPRRVTSAESPKKASAILRDGRLSSKTKTVAGSALSQAKNPRNGRYVKIDKTSGTIIAHKKSNGAYKGIPIAEKSHKQK